MKAFQELSITDGGCANPRLLRSSVHVISLLLKQGDQGNDQQRATTASIRNWVFTTLSARKQLSHVVKIYACLPAGQTLPGIKKMANCYHSSYSPITRSKYKTRIFMFLLASAKLLPDPSRNVHWIFPTPAFREVLGTVINDETADCESNRNKI